MKSILTILLIWITTVTFAQNKEVYRTIADSLLIEGKANELLLYFENELKKYSENEDVIRWLGFVHIELNNFDAAEVYYRMALKANPKCARCYFNLGRIYVGKGDYEKAMGFIEDAMNLDSQDPIYYSLRGRLKEIKGDKFGALIDHDKSVELDPDNPEFYFQRGEFNSKANYLSLALADFTKAIELSPMNYKMYFKRASVYYSQNRVKEAMLDINIAIELDSNQFSLYTGRGAIYEVMHQYNKAIDDYTKAITLNEKDYLPYLNRSSAYYKLEDLDASCKDFKILKLMIERGEILDSAVIEEVIGSVQDFCDSSKASYYYQRGVGYYNLKDYQKAINFYSLGLEKFPNNGMMLSFKGNAYMTLNQFEKAVEYYQLSLKFKESIILEIKANPRFKEAKEVEIQDFYKGSVASTYASMSECKANLGLFKEAIADINTALELAPKENIISKEVYFNQRGYIYLMDGKYDLAMADFEKSIQYNKKFALAYVNRAVAKVSSGGNVKVKNFTLASSNNYQGQAMNVNFAPISKAALKKSESNILSALNDCNLAIEIDKKMGYAYLVRGQIKQMLGISDYCMDLLTAKELGVEVEETLIKNCLR